MADQNPGRATGPRTAEGKRRSSRNALRHGLRSTALVVPGERPADWNRHLTGIVESVAPRDYLEAFLAADVAAQTWRLARVARFEQEVTAAGLEEAEADWAAERRRLWDQTQVADLRLAREQVVWNKRCVELLELLTAASTCGAVELEQLEPQTVTFALSEVATVGGVDELEVVEIPEDQIPEWWDPEPWHQWTLELLRSAVQQVADAAGRAMEDLVIVARARLTELLSEAERRIAQAELDLERYTTRRRLPSEAELERIQRYESHLRRGVARSLDQLRTLQARTVEHGPGGSEEPGGA